MDTIQSIIVTSGFLLTGLVTVFKREKSVWMMFIGGFFLGLATNSLIELALRFQ
jgi:high-affinity nickel permease